uniref:Immunoglobulin domain-containing protein n=1 Tax=Cyprinus carpio TaxID=7962 RepID=A0A8C2I1H6_CYPCA
MPMILLLSLLLLDGVFKAETDETMSVMEGDSVTLHTNLTEILNDDTLLWLFGPREFVISQITRKSDLTSFFVTDDVRFKGRLLVDQNTGSLTIRNTRKRHSGQYKLTISREKITSRIFSVDVFGVAGETGGVKSVSVMEGDSVTLQNDVTELQEDDLIVWRFGDKGVLLANIDVETNEASINVDDERFRNRLQLNQTGSLTIKDARTEHTGLYEVQIRGRESSQQFLVSVIAKPIPDPGPSTAVIVGIVVAVLLVAAVVIYYHLRISNLQKQVDNEKTVSVEEGKSVNLETDTELQKGDGIKWCFEVLYLTEFRKETSEENDIQCDVADGRFRNKLVLNKKTGNLIINNIRTIHSGLYKLQISRKNGKTEYKRFIVTVTVKEVSVKVGETVTLDPGLETLSGDLILWTFGAKNSLVIKAESGATDIIKIDRLQLDPKTGSLTITNTTDTDLGLFQLQIINRDRTRYRRFSLTHSDSTKEREKVSSAVRKPSEEDKRVEMSSV